MSECSCVIRTCIECVRAVILTCGASVVMHYSLFQVANVRDWNEQRILRNGSKLSAGVSGFTQTEVSHRYRFIAFVFPVACGDVCVSEVASESRVSALEIQANISSFVTWIAKRAIFQPIFRSI